MAESPKLIIFFIMDMYTTTVALIFNKIPNGHKLQPNLSLKLTEMFGSRSPYLHYQCQPLEAHSILLLYRRAKHDNSCTYTLVSWAA